MMLIAWQQLKSWYYDLYSIVNEYPIGKNLYKATSDEFDYRYRNLEEEEKRQTFIDILDRIVIEDVLPLGMIIITTLYSIIDVSPSHVVVSTPPIEEYSEFPEEEVSEDSELFTTYEGMLLKKNKKKKEKKTEEIEEEA
jgi:hypothetical protein